MFIIGGLLLVAINAALIGLVMRYRAARGREPRRLRSRRSAQLLIAAALSGLAIVIFGAGVIYTENASDVEASGDRGLQASAQRTAQRDVKLPSGDSPEPLQIQASGQQWLWRYEYPDGEETFSYYELVVPVDTAVVVNLASTDVVHRWFVPGLGGKFDAVPDQSNRTWFKADEEGVYHGASYQFSGASYAAMRTQVRVVSVPEYEAWLEQQAADIQDAQTFVQERDRDPRGDAAPRPAPRTSRPRRRRASSERPRDLAAAPRARHRRRPRDPPALARARHQQRPQGRRPHDDRRRPRLPGAGRGRVPADQGPAGGPRERPDRARHLQPPAVGDGGVAGGAVRAAAGDGPVRLPGPAPDRCSLARLPPAGQPLLLALRDRGRDPLHQLRLHPARGRRQPAAAALGHRLHLQQRRRRLGHRGGTERSRLPAAGAEPDRDDPQAARAGARRGGGCRPSPSRPRSRAGS